MPTADQWIYAAARSGESGAAGLQTHSRSRSVTDPENAELTLLITFGAALEQVEKTSMPPRIWGMVPLRSSTRWAMFQVSPTHDQHGRATFMIRALLFENAETVDCLRTSPACLCGAPVLSRHLSREELDSPERPAPLPSLEVSEIESGSDHTEESLSRTLAEQSEESRASLLRVALSQPTRFLLVGNEAEILAAFSLGWAASAVADRTGLGFATWWPSHQSITASLLGWPNWAGDPSANYLKVVRRMFRWDRPLKTSFTSLEEKVASRAGMIGLQELREECAPWREGRFASASARPLLHDPQISATELATTHRDAFLKELHALMAQPTTATRAELERFSEVIHSTDILVGDAAEQMRETLLETARVLKSKNTDSRFMLEAHIASQGAQNVLMEWWGQKPEKEPCPWQNAFTWLQLCTDAASLREYLAEALDKAPKINKSPEFPQRFFWSALLVECSRRTSIPVSQDQTKVVLKVLLLFAERTKVDDPLTNSFLDLASHEPKLTLALARFMRSTAKGRAPKPVFSETFYGHWVRRMVHREDGKFRDLKGLTEQIMELAPPDRKAVLEVWFDTIQRNPDSLIQDWTSLRAAVCPHLASTSPDVRELMSALLLRAFNPPNGEHRKLWMEAAGWMGWADEDSQKIYLRHLNDLMYQTPAVQGLHRLEKGEGVAQFLSCYDSVKPNASLAVLAALYVISGPDVLNRYYQVRRWLAVPDYDSKRDFHEALLALALKEVQPHDVKKVLAWAGQLPGFQAVIRNVDAVCANLHALQADPDVIEAYGRAVRKGHSHQSPGPISTSTAASSKSTSAAQSSVTHHETEKGGPYPDSAAGGGWLRRWMQRLKPFREASKKYYEPKVESPKKGNTAPKHGEVTKIDQSEAGHGPPQAHHPISRLRRAFVYCWSILRLLVTIVSVIVIGLILIWFVILMSLLLITRGDLDVPYFF